ncbi:MAG: neutral/alkaline non-lysosomal ceramidase N-terminal domain-containing protein [Verrucomicrobia bacterium]|nr:neutral/alkaline non-lysosomal ceramidase N-terminal domain-containing protein [Verrucomicrobiota bacterium]
MKRRAFINSVVTGAALTVFGGMSLSAAPARGKGKRSKAGPLPTPAGFRAGAATSNITPALGVILNGTIMQIGPAKHVHDELHARCLVLDDGAKRVAFVICDTTMISRELVNRARQLISQTTGIPPAHILISATHTHSSPRLIDLGLGEANRRYEDFAVQRMADGVQRAINNLAPARLGWGSVQKPEHVFNRRWLLKPDHSLVNPFGEKTDRAWMYAPKEVALEPAGPVDPEVAFLAVQHSDGRPLAVLANYALHYVGGIPMGTISADYFGAFSRRLEELLGATPQDPSFVAMMSNGTCGDVGNIRVGDAGAPRPALPGPYGKMRFVGHDVAEAVAAAFKAVQYQDRPTLAAVESEISIGVRRPEAARLEWAKKTAVPGSATNKLTRPQIYAREALHLAKMPAQEPVRLQAIRIGDIAVGAIPCEVFAETGLAIKKQSTARHTFVVELANGFHGYLPTPRQHELGGYETWPARSSRLEVAASDKIQAEMLRLLGRATGAAGVP